MKLTLRRAECMDDWYVIEKYEDPGTHTEWYEEDSYGRIYMHSARFCLADVEGTKAEMIDIADAIANRELGTTGWKRCAVRVEKDSISLWSPRNSNGTFGTFDLTTADELVKEMRQKLW